jgi:hypothetical protein
MTDRDPAPPRYDPGSWHPRPDRNPAAPNSWELHKPRVEIGKDTRFVCEPTP